MFATLPARAREPVFFVASPASAAPKMIVALHHASPFLTNPNPQRKRGMVFFVPA
jgi:hypothetical protein